MAWIFVRRHSIFNGVNHDLTYEYKCPICGMNIYTQGIFEIPDHDKDSCDKFREHSMIRHVMES